MRTNREFLQLAHTFDPIKHSVGGWYYSSKLDGMRCFFDGGMTRGMLCRDIPFANIEKHARFVEEKRSTGLWSRYGQPIAAPDWWLDKLPKTWLDGELYAGTGRFQHVVATVKDHVAGDGWKDISYMVFDSPGGMALCQDGRINNTNFKKELSNLYMWFAGRADVRNMGPESSFMSTYQWLREQNIENDVVKVHTQERLPFSQTKVLSIIDEQLEQITSLGGEGLMLRKPESKWEPYRSHNLLKVKRLQDAEATVIGYITGRKTDLGSKLLGKMGALLVQMDNGIKFELSGFTDEERLLQWNNGSVSEAEIWARLNPETMCPDFISAIHFSRGSRVTFKFRELTLDNVPKEARYHRRAI